MDIFVKETLYLLDYENEANILETLFVSTDKRTPGYAYEINIRDYNTGYSDLSFKMPCDITNENGEVVKNPKLARLVPLSKVRYNRTIRYMGTDTISVPAADGSTIIYPKNEGKSPEDYIMEDYTMDYVIQPLDKSRQGIGINLTYTAIDYPRFNLSKKKVGLTFDDKTITTQELSLYKNKPLSVPGSVQYIPWTEALAKDFQAIGQVQNASNLESQVANAGDVYYAQTEKTLYQKQENGSWAPYTGDSLTTWSPNAQAKTYPLSDASIKKLVNETDFSYGILATVYYWPVTESGRFEGVWYEEGGFITLSLYNTYEGSNWEGSDYLESIVWNWGALDPVEHYLSPNNACNYLRYILKDTNWKVKGDKTLFKANTPQQPWYNVGNRPTGNAATGNYYITYQDLGDGKYETVVYRYEGGAWIDQTDKTFEQIVNTDIEDPDFGTLYDIDIEQVEVSRSKEASLGQILLTDARYTMNVSNSNCYNAITSEAKLFDLYPVFDCINRTATLKLNVGKDYGLSYRYKSNLKNSTVKVDGEKVITKMYVTGGTDAQGEQNITIGEANRIVSGSAPDFTSPTINSEDNNIKTDMSNMEAGIYNHIQNPSSALPTGVVQDDNTYIGNVIRTKNDGGYTLTLPDTTESFVLSGPDRVYTVHSNEENGYNYGVGNYYYLERTNKYVYCAKQISDSGSIYSKVNAIVVNGYVFIQVGAPTDTLVIKVNNSNINVKDENGNNLKLQDWLVNDFSMRVKYTNGNLVADDEFDPNADEYIIGRSPYGTSYIYNFKYLYDNGWITKDDILDIYRINREINDLNLDFYDRYTKDLVNIRAAYNDAVNNYDIYASKADAQLEALMSQYWIDPNKASDGQFSAFPGLPKDVNGSTDFDTNKNKYKKDIYYDEIQDDGTVQSVFVKTVYFDVFGSDSCMDNYPNCKDANTVARNPYTEGQYHVVANAIGWDANYTDKLTINSNIGPYTEAQDPSKTADSYNKFVNQMKEYYYKAMKADEQMLEAQQALEELSTRYTEWEKQIAEYEKYLQENYGEYIIEGSYSNTEQPYANLLIKDGLDASDKYASPDITYTVGVVDSSGLIEFRAPQKLVCNPLIKRLHNIGQVAPHVGDYVAIQDEPMGMYGVAGLITQISRRVDDPYQNSITIDTSYTDADELVGNIITATNTVLNNKDVYGRAAIINNKGELSSTTVSNALSTGTNSISIVSTSGKVAVDDNGLTCVNPNNKNEVMRYNGTGILGSTNGGATWRELLTQDGINANYINAGTINAGKVSITDGGHDISVFNADGLTIKSQPNKPYVLGYFDEDKYEIEGFNNVEVFIGKDAKGNPIGYFNGYIEATKGGNISGWQIKPNKLESGSGNTYVGIGTGSDGYRFWAGNATASEAPFYVKSDGYLKATNANITGTITSNNATITGGTLTVGDNFSVSNNGTLKASNAIISGNITATTLNAEDGKIGGWTIGSTTLTGGNTTLNSNGSISVGSSFSVSTGGKLTASGANISGTINASEGSIGDFKINGGLKYKNGENVFEISGGSSLQWYDTDGQADWNLCDISGFDGRLGIFGNQTIELTTGTTSYEDGVIKLDTRSIILNSIVGTHINGGLIVDGNRGATGYVKIGIGLDFHYALFIDGVLIKVVDTAPSGYSEIFG